MDKKIYNDFKKILSSELIPALGCTEPARSPTPLIRRESCLTPCLTVSSCGAAATS